MLQLVFFSLLCDHHSFRVLGFCLLNLPSFLWEKFTRPDMSVFNWHDMHVLTDRLCGVQLNVLIGMLSECSRSSGFCEKFLCRAARDPVASF